MLMQIQGVISGKRIELANETGLPSGTVVTVNIQPKPLSLNEKKQLVDVLCGAWTGDPSLKSIFAEIERQRSITRPREVNFASS